MMHSQTQYLSLSQVSVEKMVPPPLGYWYDPLTMRTRFLSDFHAQKAWRICLIRGCRSK